MKIADRNMLKPRNGSIKATEPVIDQWSLSQASRQRSRSEMTMRIAKKSWKDCQKAQQQAILDKIRSGSKRKLQVNKKQIVPVMDNRADHKTSKVAVVCKVLTHPHPSRT